jgi:hypothetical protein
MHRITRLLAGGLAIATILLGSAVPATAASYDQQHTHSATAASSNEDANGVYAAAALLPSRCFQNQFGTGAAGNFEGVIYGVKAWFIHNDYMVQGNTCQIGKSRLTLQTDGNLVVYDETGKARWAASWTNPQVMGHGSHADFQGFDGNFVVYSVGTAPLWASNTCCRTGAVLAVQADGNVVIYDSNNTPLWETHSQH